MNKQLQKIAPEISLQIRLSPKQTNAETGSIRGMEEGDNGAGILKHRQGIGVAALQLEQVNSISLYTVTTQKNN